MTPGLARVIRHIHSLNGSNENGMSLACLIENRNRGGTPLHLLKGPCCVVAPHYMNGRITNAGTVVRKHPEDLHSSRLQRG
eukprot:3957085-Pyramimonas_sp.AAC.1